MAIVRYNNSFMKKSFQSQFSMYTSLFACTLAFLSYAPTALASVYTPITGDSSYKLTFDEEFNGTAIDKSKWQVTFDGNPDHTYPTYGNAQFWNSTNLKVAYGMADLAVTKCATGYCTAAVTSTHLQTYGYFEARVKMPPNAKGIGAGFWMDAQGWQFPEIDISEWLGVTPTSDYTTWHYAYPSDGTNTTGISKKVSLGDPTLWHVVGVLWNPGTITWYYDGVQVFQTSTNVNSTNAIAQWMLLTATVGGFNGNTVDSTTVFPAHMYVDYVHAYSNSPTAIAVPPQAGYGGPGDTGSTTSTPAVTLIADPTSITAGQSATLSWSSTNATSCAGTNFSALGTSGSVTIIPSSTTSYSITCTGAGGSATKSTTITVASAFDTIPPTTAITTPLAGAIVSGTTTVSASASDNIGVAKVELWKDGVLFATDTTSPYDFAWDTTKNTSATHLLQSRAYDREGNIGSSAQTSVTVSNTATTSFPATPGLGIGTRIKTTDNLNVRSKTNINRKFYLCTQPLGATGTIAGGPVSQQGYTWWSVNYDNSCDGWSVQDYLSTVIAAQSSISLATASADTITSMLRKGSTGPEVTLLQILLAKLGLFHEQTTGYFGVLTEEAVKAFQAQHNVASIGIVGPQTRELLNSLGQ
jgi:hypothetical protein